MNQETLTMFKTLTELPGIAGNEHAVRDYMRGELEKYADGIIQDRLGGILEFLALNVAMSKAQRLWSLAIWMK